MYAKYFWGAAALVMLGAVTSFLALSYMDRHSNSPMARRGLGMLFARSSPGDRGAFPGDRPAQPPLPQISQGGSGIGNPAEETTEPARVPTVSPKIVPLDSDESDFDPDVRLSRPGQNGPEQGQGDPVVQPWQRDPMWNFQNFPKLNRWGQGGDDEMIPQGGERSDGGIAPRWPTVKGEGEYPAVPQAKKAIRMITHWEPEMRMEPDPRKPDNLLPDNLSPRLVGRVIFFDGRNRDISCEGTLIITLFDERPEQGQNPLSREQWYIDKVNLKKTFQKDAMQLNGYTLRLPVATDVRQLKRIRLDLEFRPETGDAITTTSGPFDLKQGQAR
jgi:hypothetical protein